MVYCFDLDDTICRHDKRDYPNAEPMERVISVMRGIRAIDPKSKIIIHTARGMNSCHGDTLLAERKNRGIIERWLVSHDVPYDEIIFGKPLADFYIDDKAVNAFGDLTAIKYAGFSGANIIRFGGVVAKQGERTMLEYEWYKGWSKRKFNTHRVPLVLSYTLGKLYLSYVSGVSLYSLEQNEYQKECNKILDIVDEFKNDKIDGCNDVDSYCEYVHQKAKALSIEDSDVLVKLNANREHLLERTFSHGDLTDTNIIICDGLPVLIDPNPNQFLQSWIVDVAKLRASANGLTSIIDSKYRVNTAFVETIDKRYAEDIDCIKAVEKTHFIRVAHYAKRCGDTKVLENLKRRYYEL